MAWFFIYSSGIHHSNLHFATALGSLVAAEKHRCRCRYRCRFMTLPRHVRICSISSGPITGHYWTGQAHALRGHAELGVVVGGEGALGTACSEVLIQPDAVQIYSNTDNKT